MPSRRDLLWSAGGLAAALAGCAERQGRRTPAGEPLAGLGFSTPAFGDGETIPERFTCAGEDRSPPLRLETPSEVRALAVVVDDVDADGFTHWTLWNLPGARVEIPADVARSPSVLDAAQQGRNDFGELGYRGPCPPEGDDPHTYRFSLYGLDRALSLASGAEPVAVEDAIAGASLGVARFTGEFGR